MPATGSVPYAGLKRTVTPIIGSAVFGVTTTVTATRAIAFGLDNAVNVHGTAGMFKVFGDMEVTGSFASGTSLSDDLDGLGT
jgi:hypothetical protein